jgi:translocation protein SEC63
LLVSDDAAKSKLECQCEPCQLKKQRLRAHSPWKKIRNRTIKLGLLFFWVLFFLVAYKVSQVELDWTEFDPYAELGIDRGASSSEIKKAYRRLSLQYHPDKETGDPHKFMRITKAHQACVFKPVLHLCVLFQIILQVD